MIEYKFYGELKKDFHMAIYTSGVKCFDNEWGWFYFL